MQELSSVADRLAAWDSVREELKIDDEVAARAMQNVARIAAKLNVKEVDWRDIVYALFLVI